MSPVLNASSPSFSDDTIRTQYADFLEIMFFYRQIWIPSMGQKLDFDCKTRDNVVYWDVRLIIC